jgi:hypothetical protein
MWLYTEIKETNEIIWLDMVILRFKVAQNVKNSLVRFSSVCYPVGQPSHMLLDHLVSQSHEYPIPSLSSVFLEDELVEQIFHQNNLV